MAEAKREDNLPVLATSTPAARFNWVGLQPGQVKSIAQAMAMSGMFPDIKQDSAKAFVKIMAGQEMGIAPFQAMSDISIIQGKAAAGGNIYAAKVKSSGRYDYRVKKWDRTACEIEFFELVNGKRESIGVSSFDEVDARAAGLLSKDSWKRYPRNMYFNRAITAGVRTYCPDALGGVNAYTPEELGAQVDEEGRVEVTAEQITPPEADEPQTELPDEPEQQTAENDVPEKEVTAEADDDSVVEAEEANDIPENKPSSDEAPANKVHRANIESLLKRLGYEEHSFDATLLTLYDIDDPQHMTALQARAVIKRLMEELKAKASPQEAA